MKTGQKIIVALVLVAALVGGFVLYKKKYPNSKIFAKSAKDAKSETTAKVNYSGLTTNGGGSYQQGAQLNTSGGYNQLNTNNGGGNNSGNNNALLLAGISAGGGILTGLINGWANNDSGLSDNPDDNVNIIDVSDSSESGADQGYVDQTDTELINNSDYGVEEV